MSGTIPLSMTQQFDEFGKPLKGGQLYIIQAGTVSTPQNAFQDVALTQVMPYPMTLDAAGRIPQFFLSDGYIKVRLTDVNGVNQLAQDNILVIGPSAGGGGGGPAVDPTTVYQTGDVKPRYDTAIHTGFVRCNGRSLGSTTSGATELADPTAQALFLHLWLKDPNLVVLPSRGVSGAADWAANKQIFLPDWRGYALGGLDDMGSAAAGRLTATYFGTSAIVLGAAGGDEKRTLGPTHWQMPQHQHDVFLKDPGHHHPTNPIAGTGYTSGGLGPPAIGGSSANTGDAFTGITVGSVVGVANDNKTAQNPASAAAQPHATVSNMKLLTIYMKL